MTTTSLHFGPEWMRNKQQTTPTTTRPPASSVLSPSSLLQNSTSPASSYSSLLTSPGVTAPAAPPLAEKQQQQGGAENPFKYSKEEMLQVWKDGGGHGGLGLEVEMWEGVVKEIGSEPLGLREMTEGERKLFSLPLNSELRRRQSHDFLPSLTLSTADRPKLAHSNSSNTHSPLNQQRFGALTGRRRKDDGIDGGPPLSLPRRLSLSSVSGSLGGPLSPTGGGALPSPRTRIGSGTHGLDGALGSADGSWRKREADTTKSGGILGSGHGVEERDEEEESEGGKAAPFVDPNRSNGSPKDPDTSGSVLIRSGAPSPPSVQGEPSHQDSVDSTASKLSRLALLDEQKSENILDGPQDNVNMSNAPAPSGISAARPPGMDEDPSNISWSYMDPKGNVQGPFAASLMQKWYEEGYFTPDLLMKRTHLDSDWTPVGELSLRAGNEKLFFSSFREITPPGLSLRPTLPPVESQTFDRFGQPLAQNIALSQHPSSELLSTGSPLRHFRNSLTRTSTLDSYLGTPNSNQSDSPASSFSAAVGPMPSASPDLGFGVGGVRSPFGNNNAEPAFGGRVGAFDVQSPPLGGGRGGGNSFNAASDPPYVPRLASLGHRGSLIDTQGLTNPTNPGTPTTPWPSSAVSTSIPRGSDVPTLGNTPIHRTSLNNGVYSQPTMSNIPGFNDMNSGDNIAFGTEAYNYANAGFAQPSRESMATDTLSANFGAIGPGGGGSLGVRPLQDLDGMPLHSRHAMDDFSRAPGSFSNGFSSTASPIVQGPGSGFGIPGSHGIQQQQGPHSQNMHSQHLPPISTFSQPAVTTSLAPITPQTVIQPQQPSLAAQPVHSPWGIPETAQPRPRPFDAPHPTSRNIVKTPVTPVDTTSYNHPPATDPHNTLKPELDSNWGDISASEPPVPSQSHDPNQTQQRTGWSAPVRASPDSLTEQVQISRFEPPPSDSQPLAHEPTLQPVRKKRSSGSTTQASSLPVSKPPAAAPPAIVNPSPKPPSPLPAGTQAKFAWSTPGPGADDETKPTKQAGLREIQEAEAKKTEARKNAERERERASRTQPQEETQAFTASWGLPTSQVGTARPVPKEQPPAPPSNSPVPPVWTNAGKSQQAKRTLKEIQEEEERRRKAAAKEKETAAAAARRAYADSANKAPSAPAGGGAWTTVGPAGKAIPTTSARQASGTGPSTASSQPAARTVNGSPAARAAPVAPQNPKPSTPKQPVPDEGPIPPSPEFMKWLREAVRGFNQGFNTDEFIMMLLTFSLDFPPSTVEVIQDMVYMNSATLDGRRFAADFCAKRKADAANRPKGWGSGAGGKAPSLADVVKTQPKPAQSQIPFKMVKKKGVRR